MDVCARVVSQSAFPKHLNSCDLCNTQLNFIFCILTRLLNELRFVPLTGVQCHCLHDLFGVRTLTGNQTTKPPTTQTHQHKLQSDNRWAVTLSGTSHWYSNLLHFPRERTPLWKNYSRLWSHRCEADRSRDLMEADNSSFSLRPKIRSAKVRLFGLLHQKTQNSTKLDMKCLSIYSPHLFLLVMCGNG